MNIEQYREICISLEGVSEEFPFDNETLVFKVYGKIFALTSVESFTSINLKCDPEFAIELREKYDAILPGFHTNKKHWNTVLVDGGLNNSFLQKLIQDSYDLVLKGIPLNKRTIQPK